MPPKDELKEPNLIASEKETAGGVSGSEKQEVKPEVTREQRKEKKEPVPISEKSQEIKKEVSELPTSVPSTVPDPAVVKDSVLEGIEEILAGDLTDLYLSLPNDHKPEFKARGEEVARTIWKMASQGKASAKKILDLIRGWLRLVPGVNKFFLEQEAKIKTDEISRFINEQSSKSEL